MESKKEYYLTFIKKEKVSKDAYSFYFTRAFDFLPGQYIRMTLDIENPDERGMPRSFTISSSPLEDYITITTRIIQSSFKKKLESLIPGTKVKFFGPMGSFLFNKEDKTPRVFLAGGIGITPFHSMITYANAKKLAIPVTLFVSFSAVDEVIFKEELEEISKNNPNIKIIYTITYLEDPKDNWKGETGRISESLIKKYIPNVSTPIYYIAGPPKMVEAMVRIVKNMGVSDEKIKTENFIGY